MWKAVILFSVFMLSGFECGNVYRNGWNYHQQQQQQPNYYNGYEHQQSYGDVVSDWNSYQQKLFDQGYYGQNPPYVLSNNYHHQAPAAEVAPSNHHHKGKENCKHKTIPSIHNEKKKDEEIVTKKPTTTTTTTTTTKATTKKPPIVAIDFRLPTTLHVKDKLHAHEAAILNVFNETIDKVDNAFAVIKQLVDKNAQHLDNKASHVHETASKESSKLIEKFNKKIKAIEKHFEKFKGTVKRLDFDEDLTDEDEDDENDSMRSLMVEIPKKMKSDSGTSTSKSDEAAELRSDIKSSISDALKLAQDKFNKLIDHQVEKLNKKISDVGGKLDLALDKFYSTVEKLKFSSSTSTTLKSIIDWKPKSTTPIPEISTGFFERFTTPEYYKYTIPSIKYRKEEEEEAAANESIDALMTDIKRVDSGDGGGDVDDDMRKSNSKIAESTNIDGLIDAEAERERIDNTDEIIDKIEDVKSMDDLQSEIIENVKATLKADKDDDESNEFEDGTVTPTIISNDDIDENDDDDDDEDDSQMIESESESNQLSSDTRGVFDELEVIQLIPVIIEQLKRGHVTSKEREALEKIFGDLWPVMVDEVNRSKKDEMNPLLRTILQSEEVRFTKRDIAKQIGNDIYKNSLRRVYRGDDAKAQRPYISLDDDRRLLSPSERLLRMVAAIVRKANVMERSAKKIKQQKQQQQRKIKAKSKKVSKKNSNPLGILTFEPKQNYMEKILGISRIKRSLIRLNTDLYDMREFIEQVNNSEVDYSDSEDENEEVVVEGGDEEEDFDDYLNDDDYYDDDDEEFTPQTSYQSNNIFDDYEEGSVREFIELARQRDRRDKKIQHNDDIDDDDY